MFDRDPGLRIHPAGERENGPQSLLFRASSHGDCVQLSAQIDPCLLGNEGRFLHVDGEAQAGQVQDDRPGVQPGMSTRPRLDDEVDNVRAHYNPCA